MSKCLFADNLVTATKVTENFGTVNGTGTTISYDATFDSNGYISYGDSMTVSADLSATVRFKTSTAQTAMLFGTVNLIAETAASQGFCIWVTPTHIKAAWADNFGSISDILSVALDYADGEWHTVTLVRDFNTTFLNYLYVDSETVDTGADGVNSALALAMKVGGDGTDNFVGTISKPRVFDQVITEADHDVYHAGTLTSFLDSAYAIWRCDDIGNNTDGNKILDCTTNNRDLHKGDRATAATFPAFGSEWGRYFFDSTDDYLGNAPALSGDYTITGVKQGTGAALPEAVQETDTTFLDTLTAPKGFWGYLYNLGIIPSALSPMQLLHARYQHLYWVPGARAQGIHARLIHEQTCKLALFMQEGRRFLNCSPAIRSPYGMNGLNFFADGIEFPNTNSVVYSNFVDPLDFRECTFVMDGDFDGSQICGLLQVDTATLSAVLFTQVGNSVSSSAGSFNVSSYWPFSQLALTMRRGCAARVYIDGVYRGNTSSTYTFRENAIKMFVGNTNTLNVACDYRMRQMLLFDTALTDKEIEALYLNTSLLGEGPMEQGTRTTVYESFSGAVSKTVAPSQAFQLIAVEVKFDAAPTTSEDISVVRIDGSAIEWQEAHFDPSTSAYLTHPLRFDKRFTSADSIKVTYTNTDARTVEVAITYQTDDSVV